MQSPAQEIPAASWARVFREAAQLGVVHAHLTGGEPLRRTDLTELVRSGRAAGLYINLITSGVGLTGERLAELVEAGVDHLQLSFQDAEECFANEVAGARAHALKLRVSEWVRSSNIAFTVNMVVHRQNLDRLEQMIELAEQTGASRLEIANVQYYGWALRNRRLLLPTREQLTRSVTVVESARERLRGRMRIDFVLPDYYARFPKACMGGWGRRLLLIDPAGQAMPCHAAGIIPGLEFSNVEHHSLRWIWEHSPSFNRFRGEDWMQEPCRSCDRRTEDFGGCRCQAFLLSGDAEAADPVCSLARDSEVVRKIVAETNNALPDAPLDRVYRIDPQGAR